MDKRKKDTLDFPFLFTLITFRFFIDFILVHVLKTELACFKAITLKLDNPIEKLFNKKKFTLIAPDFTRLIACGFKEAKFLSLQIFEIYSRRIYERCLKMTKSRRIVIFDVGANMGVFTLKVAKRIREQGLVVAIEPHPYNYRRLLENICLNGLDNIIVLNVALGEVSGSTPLWLPPSTEENTGIASTIFKISNHFVRVPVKTLAQLMEELNIQLIDLLKLDAEGAELAILKGLEENLHKVQSLAIAAEHFSGQAEEISKYLSNEGFKVRVKSLGNLPYVYAEPLHEKLQ